jgi:hypothetical protein
LASKKERLRSSKWLIVDLLAREALGDADAGDRLVEVAVDQRQAQAGGPVGVAHPHPPEVGQQDHQRHHGQRNQGQLPAQAEHGDDDAAQQEDGARQPGDGPGDELLQDPHVADQPAHHAADAEVVVEGQRQVVQVAEERAAHVGHHLGAHVGHQADAVAVGQPLDQRRRQEEHGPPAQGLRIAGRDPLVDGLADDPGLATLISDEMIMKITATTVRRL